MRVLGFGAGLGLCMFTTREGAGHVAGMGVAGVTEVHATPGGVCTAAILSTRTRTSAPAYQPSTGSAWCKGSSAGIVQPLSHAWRQALEEERLGPRREAYSDDRSMRLAVQEGATALVCSLMPAIEPVVLARARPAGSRVWEGLLEHRRKPQLR